MVHGQRARARRLLLPLPVLVPGPLRPGGAGPAAGPRDRAHQRKPPRSLQSRIRPAGGVSDRGRADGPVGAARVEAHPLSVTSVVVVGASGRLETELRAAGLTDVDLTVLSRV